MRRAHKPSGLTGRTFFDVQSHVMFRGPRVDGFLYFPKLFSIFCGDEKIEF